MTDLTLSGGNRILSCQCQGSRIRIGSGDHLQYSFGTEQWKLSGVKILDLCHMQRIWMLTGFNIFGGKSGGKQSLSFN